jgi:hypothetical protein
MPSSKTPIPSDLDQLMSDEIDKISLVRIESKLDRIGDRLQRYEEDVSGVRQRIHDLTNQVSPIIMLDLPGRIRTADTHRADVESRLKNLENVEQQRKGAAALAKVLWTLVGASGVGAVALVFRMIQLYAH